MKRGLSQHKMAEFLDIPLRTYQSYEDLSTGTAINLYKIMQSISNGFVVDDQIKIEDAVKQYVSNNPGATWQEIYDNVDNKYKNAQTLRAIVNHRWKHTDRRLTDYDNVASKVARYRSRNPSATWNEIFKNTNTGYTTVASLRKAIYRAGKK